MQQSVQDYFSIVLPTVDTVQMFGDKLKISCIAAAPQAHNRPRLIINLTENLMRERQVLTTLKTGRSPRS